jgi:3-hydroxy acid dehydrogenase/malonic semialdehyde reductase
MDLAGRTVLVTGASSGIGEACARRFAAMGCRLVVAARRGDRVDRLADELRAAGTEVHATAVDVRDRSAVEAWIASLPAAFDEVGILVNNAGLARGLSTVQEGEASMWEEMIDTNLKGLLWVTRAVLPGMVARASGHVITIGSIAGHEVYPNGNVYCATKHAVAALNRAMAIDTLGSGVRTSSVDPGMVETEFSIVRFSGDEKKAEAVYAGMRPLTAEDVADAVAYCATRPPHANVRELVLMPTDQATAVNVNRR